MWTSECHTCTDRCICTVGEKDNDGDETVDRDPECPVVGHAGGVHQVEFSDDGAQVVSGSIDDLTIRVWDVASGTQILQLPGDVFALVEGLSGEHTRIRHVLTALDNTLRIYECAKEQQHGADGAAAALVACFKAPQPIFFVRCHGATICVGCDRGAVCILSVPFLTV